MISTLKRIQARRAAQDFDSGFTLIELLIVIVVLGILAAVVVFSLGSVTSTSAVSACQADGATVETAIAAFNAQNTDTTITADASNLVSSSYIVSFPSNPLHYQMAMNGGKLYVANIADTTAITATGAINTTSTLSSTLWNPWNGAGTCVKTTTVS